MAREAHRGGREALAGKEERTGERELRRKVRELERALGRKTYELEPMTAPQRRPPADPVERAIVDEALANQTDGYPTITAFVRRRLGIAATASGCCG